MFSLEESDLIKKALLLLYINNAGKIREDVLTSIYSKMDKLEEYDLRMQLILNRTENLVDIMLSSVQNVISKLKAEVEKKEQEREVLELLSYDSDCESENCFF